MPLTSSILHTNPRPTPASTISTSGNACLSPGHHGLNHLLLKTPDTFQTSPVNPQPHHLHQQQQDLNTPLATAHILLLGIAATSHKHILPLAATPLFYLPIHHFSPPKRKYHIAAAHGSILPFRTSTHQQKTILFFFHLGQLGHSAAPPRTRASPLFALPSSAILWNLLSFTRRPSLVTGTHVSFSHTAKNQAAQARTAFCRTHRPPQTVSPLSRSNTLPPPLPTTATIAM